MELSMKSLCPRIMRKNKTNNAIKWHVRFLKLPMQKDREVQQHILGDYGINSQTLVCIKNNLCYDLRLSASASRRRDGKVFSRKSSAY